MTIQTTHDLRRVLRALADGCEAPPEISAALETSMVKVNAWLEQLCAAGLVECDERVPYKGRGVRSRAYHRYRLKEGAAA